MRALLDEGADANATARGWTALMMGQVWTALMLASFNGHSDVVKALLDGGPTSMPGGTTAGPP